MPTVEQLLIRIDATTEQLRTELRRADTSVATFGQRMDRRMVAIDRSARRVARGFSDIRFALGGLAAASTLVGFTRVSDSMTLLDARLRLVSESASEAARMQDLLFGIAQNTRTGFESTSRVYARLARASGELDVTSNELASTMRTINQLVQISGATAIEANSALIQLSQGFASGTIRGEEYRSVIEQIPAVATAVAEGLRISFGELTELAFGGGLTPQLFLQGLTASANDAEAAFADLPRTIGAAVQQLRNDMFRSVAAIDDSVHSSERFIGAIDRIREVVRSPEFVSGMATVAELAATLAENLDLVVVAGVALVGSRIGAVFGPWGRAVGFVAGAVGGLIIRQRTLNQTTTTSTDVTARLAEAMQALAINAHEAARSNAQLSASLATQRIVEARVEMGSYERQITDAQAAMDEFMSAPPGEMGGNLRQFAEQTYEAEDAISALQNEINSLEGSIDEAATIIRRVGEEMGETGAVAFSISGEINDLTGEFIRAGDVAEQYRHELNQLGTQYNALASQIMDAARDASIAGDTARLDELNDLYSRVTASYETQAAALRERYTPAAEDAAGATREVADAIEEVSESVKKPGLEEVADTFEEIRAVGEEVGDTLGSAFEDLIIGGGELNNVLQDVILSLARIAAQQLVFGPITSFFGDLAAGLAGGGGTGVSVGKKHTGGGRGGGRPTTAPAEAFIGAERFHSGRVPGLAPDERPIIIKNTEGVFTPDQMKALGGGTTYINQTNNIDAGAIGPGGLSPAVISQVTQQLKPAMSGIAQEAIRTNIRPNGMLNR